MLSNCWSHPKVHQAESNNLLVVVGPLPKKAEGYEVLGP